ncbi:hypothetical protein ACFLUZ_03195 [Chloroflexota bacterium]
MASKDKLILEKHGYYIQHLRAQKNLSFEVFAERLDVDPSELRALEEGLLEVSNEVTRRLVLASDANEYDMEKVFGAHYWEVVRETGLRCTYVSYNHESDDFRATISHIIPEQDDG